jgi:hypothetical protein
MDKFFNSLKRKKTPGIFNPWFERDPANDALATAPQLRLDNLKQYLAERQNAQYLLLAEAVGYQGGHFTGIPMTSERIILGNKSDAGILPEHVCNEALHRTSNTEIYPDGFNEPTATIVWQKLNSENLDTRNFVLWNAFPWHPYKRDKGLLTNRTPSNSEMLKGLSVLNNLLEAFNFKTIIALGNKAHATLKRLNIKTKKVRHPAMGGADLFREQFVEILLEQKATNNIRMDQPKNITLT